MSTSLRSGALYARAYRSMLFPAWQRAVHGRPIGAHLRELEKTQWLAREERDKSQLESLRALLEHAGRSVPYWRDLFRRVGFDARQVRSVSDLEALPLLTKD
ncbi:MAG: glycosyltransferase, partial [Polyangiaceae bacterium]